MTKSELYEKRAALYTEKMKLDKFFTLYLDKFGSKMDSDKPNTKIWGLYKAKLKEYGSVTTQIRQIEYWISK
jgi:hypothetical protein